MNLILHRAGAYQLYSTISDRPCFDRALTLDELTRVIELSEGESAVNALPERLARAHAKGCSSLDDETLADCIALNRAGPNEEAVPHDEFVRRWLTLPEKEKTE